jgi:hypothetical protein
VDVGVVVVGGAAGLGVVSPPGCVVAGGVDVAGRSGGGAGGFELGVVDAGGLDGGVTGSAGLEATGWPAAVAAAVSDSSARRRLRMVSTVAAR